jgi:hypothetical protein
MISQIIEKGKKMLMEPEILEEDGSNQETIYITLPFIPILSQQL